MCLGDKKTNKPSEQYVFVECKKKSLANALSFSRGIMSWTTSQSGHTSLLSRLVGLKQTIVYFNQTWRISENVGLT